MNRRSHKKSRNGCSPCKRRHIKCDETRPSCHNCRMAERTCDFETIQQGASGVVSQTSNVGRHSDGVLSFEEKHKVNIIHMEALLHFNMDLTFPDFTFDNERVFRDVILQLAVAKPWLLHEVMAISLRHLAWSCEDRADFLLPQAKALQSKAMQLFREHNSTILEENNAANFIFASILGRHHLADTLSFSNKGFNGFLQRYIDFGRIHRGVRTIASLAWSDIVDSDLQPFVRIGLKLYDEKPSGNDLDDLKAAVSRSSSLTPEAIKHCLEAIDLLQIGFDKLKEPDSEQRYQMACNWSIMCSAGFMDILEQRKSEALVIFGHYAVLLHSARHIWQIGDCGVFILQGIVDQIGSEWNSLLTWPLTVVKLSEGLIAKKFEINAGTANLVGLW